jgi:hypothetical protein
VSLVVANLGPERVGYLSSRDWAWISGALAVLSTLCSPMARVSTRELSRQFEDWRRRR